MTGVFDRKRKKKKGFVTDIMMAIIFLFVFALTTFVALTIYNEYKDNSNTMVVVGANDSRAEDIVANSTRALEVMDYGFLILFIGLTISTVVTAFFIRSHPVMFVFSLIMLLLVLLLAVIFSNIFMEIEDEAKFQNATDTYSIIPEIMDNLPLYIFGMFILVALAFYSKTRLEI